MFSPDAFGLAISTQCRGCHSFLDLTSYRSSRFLRLKNLNGSAFGPPIYLPKLMAKWWLNASERIWSSTSIFFSEFAPLKRQQIGAHNHSSPVIRGFTGADRPRVGTLYLTGNKKSS